MRARKTDANLGDIVDLARKLGFLVHVTNGDWDATVQLRGRTELWELKDGSKSPSRTRYTDAQKKLLAEGWLIRRVANADDVLLAHREIRGVPF